ncbi:uncharacterized protein LOC143028499 isoform X2 [Oratosquilla oratoria]
MSQAPIASHPRLRPHSITGGRRLGDVDKKALRQDPQNGGQNGAPSAWGRALLLVSLLLFLALRGVGATYPSFTEGNTMSVLLLPSGTRPGTIIYRVRAHDRDDDYPLDFSIVDTRSRTSQIVYIRARECRPIGNAYCDADVYLAREVKPGQSFTFNISVTDTTGDRTTVRSRIEVTNGNPSDSQIFMSYAPTAIVPEDAKIDVPVTSLIVRKRTSYIEFYILGHGNDMFIIKKKPHSPISYNATIYTLQELDFETVNLYQLEVCALYPYTDTKIDTRNIACVSVTIVVDDRQDTAPIFIVAPPLTRIPNDVEQGDVLVKVVAQDGDKGEPRSIIYTMVPTLAAFADFFEIGAESGEVRLIKSINDLVDQIITIEPILLLKITAEEVAIRASNFPELTTEIEIGLGLLDLDIMAPEFAFEEYWTRLRENSPVQTPLYFEKPFLKDAKGTFSLSIEGDNGTFTVSPPIVRNSASFMIKVNNQVPLDFEERKRIDFKLKARQVAGPGSATASITVYLDDDNDNLPVFTQQIYEKSIYENITVGASILQVKATDRDESNDYGAIVYTRLIGSLEQHLTLNTLTGLITCKNNSGLDRETSEEYELTVEARDGKGEGNAVMAKIRLFVKDINDRVPEFELPVYEGVLEPNLQKFREPVIVKAIDTDAEEPNNLVTYAIDPGTFSAYFQIDSITGRLSVREQIDLPNVVALRSRQKRQAGLDEPTGESDILTLDIRASDKGVPQLSSKVPVLIYTKNYVERYVNFIFPYPPDDIRFTRRRGEIERQLRTLTGGSKVTIQEVREYGTQGILSPRGGSNRSIVTALIKYPAGSVVDVEKLSQEFNMTKGLEEDNKPLIALQQKSNSYLAVMVVLCILLALIIIAIIFCCFWPTCPLYKERKKFKLVNDDSQERVSYIRVDDRERGRQAWSGDERQRYWKIQGGSEGRPLDERSVIARPAAVGGARDVFVEDLDEARQSQRLRVESRTSQRSQERRMFVLRDGRGQPRAADTLREGETYYLEDIEDATPRTVRLESGPVQFLAATGENGGQAENNSSTYSKQGNVEVLRLHASPRGGASRDEIIRVSERGRGSGGGAPHSRRAGGESEVFLTQEELRRRGPYYQYDDTGGGVHGRLVEGQSHGATPRSDYDEGGGGGGGGRGFVNTAIRYLSNGSPSHSSAEAILVTEDGQELGTIVPRLRIRTPIQEETNSLLEAEGARSSRREKRRTPRAKVHSYGKGGGGGGGNSKDGSSSQRSSRSHSNLQGSYSDGEENPRKAHYPKVPLPYNSHYHHTKASLLRLESNLAKLEEDQKNNPPQENSRRNSVSATEGRRSSSVDGSGRTSSNLEGRRSLSQMALDGRRSNSQAALDGRRSNSQAALDGRRSNSQAALDSRRGGAASHGATSTDGRRNSVAALEGRSSEEKQEILKELESLGIERIAARRLMNRSIGADERLEEYLAMERAKRAEEEAAAALARKRERVQRLPSDVDDSEAEAAAAAKAKEKKKQSEAKAGSRYMEWYNRRKTPVDLTPSDLQANEEGTSVEPATEPSTTEASAKKKKKTSTTSRVGRDHATQNLPDDAKAEVALAAEDDDGNYIEEDHDGRKAALDIMDSEINLGVQQGSNVFDNTTDLEEAARHRRRRNYMTEKKSIFTIAYDDMRTQNLRPESAAAEP